MEKKEADAVFPAKLLEYRIKRGWSQAALAAEIGMDEESVRRWEKGRGRPSLYAQQKLCQVFDTTPDDLGLTANSRLKHISSTTHVEATPTVPEEKSARFSPLPENSPRQEGTHGLLHSPFLPSLWRGKWLIVLTFCLVAVLCLLAIWKGNAFQAGTPAHPPSATRTATPLSHVYYSFEGGIDQWFYEGHILGLQSSSDYAKQGYRSLKVTFSSRHQGDDPFIEAAPLPDKPLSSGQTVSMYVYVPATSPTIAVHPFVLDSMWHWLTSPQTVKISPRTWTRVTYTVPASVSEATRIGIQFESTPFNVAGTIYIDAVGWS